MKKRKNQLPCEPLSKDDVQKLLQIPGRDGFFIAIGLFSMLRLTEIRTLRWDQFIMGGRPISRTRVQRLKKKREVWDWITWNEEVQKRALEYWEERNKPFLYLYVFGGREPMSDNGVNNCIIKPWFKKLDINAVNHSSHTLRKTGARRALDILAEEEHFSIAILKVSRMLGHENVQTTYRYLGIEQEELAAVFERMSY